MLKCEQCGGQWHPTCLGLGKHAMPGGHFTCAECTKFAACIPEHAAPDVKEAAHTLVWLRAQRVRESSQNAYASSLHRFVHWATIKAGKQLADVLPPSKEGAVSAQLVQLFMAWACSRYKASTIEHTLTAIKDWHKSKQIGYDHLCTQPIKDLLTSIKAEQGSEGVPKGKVGMTRPVLRLLIGYLHGLRKTAGPNEAMLHLRDLTWLVLGYFGMLRRSEIIAFKIQDVKVSTAGGQSSVELTIRKSKTDRRGEGALVTITGVTKDDIPIATIVKEWLAFRAACNARPDDPLFTKWNLDSRSLSHLPIATGQALAERLKLHLTSLVRRYPGLSVNPLAYGMHSLRRGGVMAAWQAGVPVEKIQAHGRWKSDAVRAYMETTRSMRLQVTQGM